MRRPPTSGGAGADAPERAALSHSSTSPPSRPTKHCDCVLSVDTTNNTAHSTNTSTNSNSNYSYSYQYYYDCRCIADISNNHHHGGEKYCKEKKRQQSVVVTTNHDLIANHQNTTSNYFKSRPPPPPPPPSYQTIQTTTTTRRQKLAPALALAPKSAFYYLLTVCVPPTLNIATLLLCATLIFATNFNSLAIAAPASNHLDDEAPITHHHHHRHDHRPLHHELVAATIADEQRRGQTHPDGYHHSSSSSSSASPLVDRLLWSPVVRSHLGSKTESLATRRRRLANKNNENDARHQKRLFENQHRHHWDLGKMRSRTITRQQAEPNNNNKEDEEMSLSESSRKGPLSHFFTSGARFTADNEIDTYNVDDIFNDDADGDLDFDDLEDDDDADDEDEDLIDDLDEEELDDDEEDDPMGLNNNGIDENNSRNRIISSGNIHNLSGRKSHQYQGESSRDKLFRRQKNVIDRHVTQDGRSRRFEDHHHAKLKSSRSKPLEHHQKSSPSSSTPKHSNIVSANSKPESHHYHQRQPSRVAAAAAAAAATVGPAIGPHLPYQSPIVVSISDNSYVSASPVVSTPVNGNLYNVDGRVYSNFNDEPIVESDFEASDNRNNILTTSTTATTTSSNSYSISRTDFSSSNIDVYLNNTSNNSQTTELDEGNEITGAELTTITTSTSTQREKDSNLEVRHSSSPIVFRKFDRYNFVVDDSPQYQSSPKNEKQSQQKQQEIEQAAEVRNNDAINNKVRTNMIMSSSPNGHDDNADDLAHVESQHTTTNSSSPWAPSQSTMQPDKGVSIDIDLSEDDDDDDRDDDEDDAATSDTNPPLGRSADVELSELIQLQEGRPGEGAAEVVTAKYSNLIISPKDELPSFTHRYWHDSHLASIQMVQEEPNELDQGGINSAIIAILFGIGATGMLVLVVGLKMGTIRERVAYKGRRRSLVPDTDYLINTIPIIRSESLQTLDRKVIQSDS